MSEIEELLNSIKSKFGDYVEDIKLIGRNKLSVTIRIEGLVELAVFLRDNFGFIQPIGAGGIDLIGEKLIQMVYYVYSPKLKCMVLLRSNAPRNKPVFPSLISVWSAMDYHEREAWEMLGITFEGNPNLSHLLLPEDWEEGYPLRKDFKLK